MRSRALGLLALAGVLLILVGSSSWFRKTLGATGQNILGTMGGTVELVWSHLKLNQPISAQLDTICDELRASKDTQTTRQILEKLRDLLNHLPHNVASREVCAFLATQKDASTHLDLTLNPRGRLGDASSLRVFLLDYLGQIDPPAAGQLAVQTLSHYTTPDEWAVSLRNYAWAHPTPDAQQFLTEKVQMLLANTEWTKNPTTGFLQAFDVVVYAHDTAVTPTLSGLLRDRTNRPTAHAAYLAMDRLILEEPAPMLRQIVQQPALMAGWEKTRADFVARADLAQPDQRALVEQYLLDPSRSPEELASFAAIFPNDNYMISYNLLSTNQPPTGAVLIQRAREAIAVVEQWQGDPRFRSLQPLLAQMQQRMGILLQEAGGPR